MKLLEHFKELSLYPNNAEELKGLILQLAIQGKLTKGWRVNNPNTEPASELLKRIEAEKQQLIADKKIKKEKPLPPIEDDEIPYELPEGWVWCRLGTYTHNFGQKKPDKAFEYIDVASIDNHLGVIRSDLNVVKASEAPSRARKIIEKGCVIYSTVRPYLLNIACVDRDFEFEAIASTAFAILNPIQECSPRHLYYTLRSPFYIEYVESFMKGVAYPAINDKNLLNGPIPVPPSEEQKAIVEVVNTLFKEVEQLETLTKKRIQLKESFVVSALNKLTEAKNTQQEWNFLQQHFSSFFTEKKNIKSLRETILQLAVQGKLTKGWRVNNPNTEPASELLKRIEAEKQQLIAKKKIKKEKTLPPVENDEMPYELPVGWKFTRLGSIIKISSGDGLTSTNMDKDGSIPVYGGNGITGYHSKFNVSKPEIVIGRVGYYCGSIHLTEEKAWVTDNAFVTKFSEQNIYRGYLVWLLKGTNLKENENATAQPVISGKKIYPIVIGFPPLEEQKAIVEKVNSLMALCDELEQQIETSNIQIEQLMQSCVAEALA